MRICCWNRPWRKKRSVADSLIVQAIKAQRAAVARGEKQLLRDLARLWVVPSYRYLQQQVTDLMSVIQAQRDQGQPVWIGHIHSLERYQTMMEQARRTIDGYNRAALGRISGAEADAVRIGGDNGRQLINLAEPDAPVWTRVNQRETRILSGMLSEASPLSALLNKSWGQSKAGIEEALTIGVSTGQGSAWIADQMMKAVNIPYQRAQLIARTEVNRAYREANVEAMRETRVARGFRRMCYPPTACFACLMLDGEIYSVGAQPCDHPNGKCSFVPVTKHFDPAKDPSWERGQDWFSRQDEETQRRIMGAGRFELWKQHGVDPKSMVYIKDNPIWGGSPTARPIQEINKMSDRLWAAAGLSEARRIVLPLGKKVREEIIENGLKRLNFTHHLDKMGAYAELMDSFEDYQDVIIHGNRFGFCFQDANNPDTDKSDKPFREDDVTVSELASFLRKSEAYNGGKIRLVSCEAGGVGGFAAQALADELGVVVLAPTETLHIDINGNYKIIGEDGINGDWAFFEPHNRSK